MNPAKRIAAVATLVVLGGFLLAAYAKNQGRLGKIHYQDCNVTPEKISASIHGDVVFWSFDEDVGASDSVEVRFDKKEGSPCSNGNGTYTVSAAGSGYCMINSSLTPPKTYKYSVWKNGQRCKDPSVGVEDGGRPGGGKKSEGSDKKADKKKP